MAGRGRRAMNDPVFILAPPRSFTSVVCGMIGRHPQLFGLPEVNLFGGETLDDLGRWHRMRPRLRHGLLRAVAELKMGRQDERSVEDAEQWLRGDESATTADIYHELAALAAPRKLVDKSPMYVLEDGCLDRIHRAFPSARYIHLVRHPLATGRSMVGLRNTIKERGGLARQGGRGEGPSVSLDTFWLQPHLRAKEYLDAQPVDSWIRIRGEDLMADLDRGLAQLAEWLDIRTDRDAIEEMKHPERSPFARPGPSNARYGNDPSFMELPALRPWAPKHEDRLDDPLPEGVSAEMPDVLRHYAELWGYR